MTECGQQQTCVFWGAIAATPLCFLSVRDQALIFNSIFHVCSFLYCPTVHNTLSLCAHTRGVCGADDTLTHKKAATLNTPLASFFGTLCFATPCARPPPPVAARTARRYPHMDPPTGGRPWPSPRWRAWWRARPQCRSPQKNRPSRPPPSRPLPPPLAPSTRGTRWLSTRPLETCG